MHSWCNFILHHACLIPVVTDILIGIKTVIRQLQKEQATGINSAEKGRVRMMMRIRHTAFEDLDRVMEIYAYARQFMAQTGNPRQWGATCWPPRDLVRQDIERGKSYVCVDGDDRIMAVFYYDYADHVEPCYAMIEDGAWKDPSPYGVVHRIASAQGTRGAGSFCLNWAYEQSGHLRIDTHPDNRVMQGFLKKHGFEYCGIIHVEEDNDPRYAYEKSKEVSTKVNENRSLQINGQIGELIRLAIGQLSYSYTPYSHFKVGAALLCKNGKIFTGCNIENAAYTPCNCAERTAIFKAVSEGEKDFRAICIVGGKEGILTEYAPPCGVCRQVMMEFCDPDTFKIILATSEDHYVIKTLRELMPLGFGPGNLA